MTTIFKAAQLFSEGQIEIDELLDTIRQSPWRDRSVSDSPWVQNDDPDGGTVSEIADAVAVFGLQDHYDEMLAAVPHLAPHLGGDTFSAPIEVAKSDKRRNLVFGWANVAFTPEGQVVDHQGHMIDTDDLEEAAYKFVVKYRTTGDMHTSEAFGEMVESMIVTQDKIEKAGFPQEMLGRWWIGFRVPPEHWDRVVSGERSMFSIQGKAQLEPVEKRAQKVVRVTRLAKRLKVAKHDGPGPHDSGSPQEAHSGKTYASVRGLQSGIAAALRKGGVEWAGERGSQRGSSFPAGWRASQVVSREYPPSVRLTYSKGSHGLGKELNLQAAEEALTARFNVRRDGNDLIVTPIL